MNVLPGWQGGHAVFTSSAVVTLTGTTIYGWKFNGSARAELRINDNGNAYKFTTNGGTSQIFGATDWVRPTSAAPGLYEVRYTNLSGPSVSATVGQGVWQSLASANFAVWQIRSSPGTDSSQFDIEIRLDGGPVLASASYTLEAEYMDLSF